MIWKFESKLFNAVKFGCCAADPFDKGLVMSDAGPAAKVANVRVFGIEDSVRTLDHSNESDKAGDIIGCNLASIVVDH
jgi:hypothetical protein